LRGPIPGVPPALQPVAHALQHAAEVLPPLVRGLRADQVWERPSGSAPVGFHLAHLTGALDRLFTYARGEAPTDAQRDALARERTAAENRPDVETLLAELERTLTAAVDQLRRTPAETLLDPREVGQARLPSTVIGLLFHGAEHTARHAGQIATLAIVVRERR
jgi:uncharacterized damage-inducible protein DinB